MSRMAADLPHDEANRLAVLHEHQLLDTEPQEEFDDLVRLAAHVCGVPIAAVSLVDEHRQWFKAIVGLDLRETARDLAFCAHTILQPDVLIIRDAETDARFQNNPLVTGEPNIRFYAGAPLLTEDGQALGSLCVIDKVARDLSVEQEETLRLLARQVSSHLRAARRNAQREGLVEERERLVAEQERLVAERALAEAALGAERDFTQALLESLQEGIVACDADGTLTVQNQAMRELHGLPVQVSPERWADHFGLYEADGLTPMRTEDIPLMRALQGEAVRDAEVVITPTFGPTRTLLASGRPIHGPGGEQLGAVVALRDVTERRQAERELSRLAAIVESSEEAILGATLDGILVSWNKGAERLYGYAASEMMGQPVSVLTPPDQCSPVPDAIARLVRGEPVEPIEVARVRRDGTEFYAALTFSPIHDASGAVIGLSCVARDVTVRKRAEAALAETHAELIRSLKALDESNTRLQESDERLRRLTDAAFEGISVTQDGMLMDVSPAFAALFGYDAPVEMVGLAAIKLAAPESRALAVHKIATCDEEPYEAALLRRDGTTFQAELRGRPIQLGGHPARVTAVRDITDRRRQEEVLRRSEARLAEAQRVAQIGSWEYDIATGRIVWSDELFRLFEMDPADGTPTVEQLMAHYHPDDVVMHATVTEQAMRDGRPYEFDIRILRRDGSICWTHAVGRGERDSTGGVSRLFGTLMDITERKLAEERFRVLFERSSHAHLLFDEAAGIIDCNAAALSMMRCRDRAQLLGIHPARLSPVYQPDGRRSDEKGAEMCALALRNGGHRFEWQRQALDGHEYPVEVALTPVTLEGRTVLLTVWHDLTERKRQEERIKDHTIILEFQKAELEKANVRLEALATTDGLTELTNHRAFQERLAEEVGRAARYGQPMSLMLLDVDQFKQYNDKFGHPQGDDVLRRVASLLRDSARETDMAARYGGEEFVLILPQTDLSGAAVFAERLRAAVEGHPWPLRAITASFGLASLRMGEESGAELIARADAALYRSKASGRNRVTCTPDFSATAETLHSSSAL